MWLFDDLDSQVALRRARDAPLSVRESALVDFIRTFFFVLECVMAWAALGATAGVGGRVLLRFGPAWWSLLGGFAIVPAIWLLLRKPRALLQSAWLDRVADRAIDAQRFSTLGSSTSPIAVPVQLPEER